MNALGGAFDGDLWCGFCLGRTGNVQLDTFRVKPLDLDRVEFKFIGRYEPTLIQSFAGGMWMWNASLQMRNGLLYVKFRDDLVTVLSVSENGPPKLIAHFAAPGMRFCEPLSDGRAIAGGDRKLWLLGPPRR